MRIKKALGLKNNWFRNLFSSVLWVTDLSEVGALGRPEGGRPHPQDEGGGQEGVERGVELGRDVGGVAEDAQHQGPFNLRKSLD